MLITHITVSSATARGIAPAVVYGGTPMRETLTSLRRGCDILVGTPGRVLDLLERDYIGLEGIT